jgi:Uncharacterized protein conserved in bacteria (DUF2188)
MNCRAVHTIWKDPYWVNVVDEHGDTLSSHDSMRDAIDAGDEQADDADVPHVVHAKDGSIVSAYHAPAKRPPE